MRLNQSTDVPEPPERVWACLTDIPRVARCLPGARLTGQPAADSYEGSVRVSIGPLAMHYTGTLTIERRDDDGHVLVCVASGRDRRGAGSATARLTASLAEHGGGTRLRVATELRLTGRVAALGRGVQDVATTMFDEFARSLAAEIGSTAGQQPELPELPRDERSVRLGRLVLITLRRRLARALIALGRRVSPAEGAR